VRAAAYVRVSATSQVDGYSLDAQERLFRELCKNRGWELVKIYREEGKSAHAETITRRPVFRQLLEDATRHEFDVVVVHTLDRWSRNLKVTLDSLSILGKNGVGLVSIAENIDYSRPEGMLFTQMLGAFAQYYSEALGTHVKKGLEQRALEGKHNGAIPFGYASCYGYVENGEKRRICNPEHPGGVHIHTTEGPAVSELFRRYAQGYTTLNQLAAWLNEQEFRTRNTHPILDAVGNFTSGSKFFTYSSVRGILHNPFYTGKVCCGDRLLPGLHQQLVKEDVFALVQTLMRKNSGRSETLKQKPGREYLLKGLIRCAYCGMPMWAQTYENGCTYYREYKGSRSSGLCRTGGAYIPCHVADGQVRKLVGDIELNTEWLDEAASIISLKDEVARVKKEREAIKGKLRRMATTFIDGVFPEEEYNRQKKLLEMELDSLVVPKVNVAEEANKLLNNFRELWATANMGEQRKFLLTMLDAVYVDAKKKRSIAAIKPKPPFLPVFQAAAKRAGSDILILNELLNPNSINSSWRQMESGGFIST
jgi:DNA invertase Pin-like site-specific DNA recombinase